MLAERQRERIVVEQSNLRQVYANKENEMLTYHAIGGLLYTAILGMSVLVVEDYDNDSEEDDEELPFKFR
jgi:hypothetical protein